MAPNLHLAVSTGGVVNGNGNNKKKRRKLIIWGGLEAAEANLRSSQADFERAKVDAEGPDVPLLKRAYDRAVGMAKDGVVSASALDDAEKNYAMALNKQNVSKAQVTVLKAKIAQS